MILDSGICERYEYVNIGDMGNVPVPELKFCEKYYFGDLEYSSKYTDDIMQEPVEINRRIRIWQDTRMSSQSIIQIGSDKYKVVRCYHGQDKEMRGVTDISLEIIKEDYADDNDDES